MNHWAENYVGQPYAEQNCGEFYLYILRTIFGRDIEVPEYKSQREKYSVIGEALKIHADQVDHPVEGDCVLMICNGRLSHVGAYCLVGGQACVVHAMKSAGQVCLHSLYRLPMLGLKVEGFYRV